MLKFGLLVRIQKLKKFAKAITKLTRSDLVRLVVPEVFRFEEISKIFNRYVHVLNLLNHSSDQLFQDI